MEFPTRMILHNGDTSGMLVAAVGFVVKCGERRRTRIGARTPVKVDGPKWIKNVPRRAKYKFPLD